MNDETRNPSPKEEERARQWREAICRIARMIGVREISRYYGSIEKMLNENPHLFPVQQTRQYLNKLKLAAALHDIPVGSWEKYYSAQKSYLSRKGLEDGISDDAISDAYRAALQHSRGGTFRGDAHPKTFLIGVARNMVRHLIHQQQTDAISRTTDLIDENGQVRDITDIRPNEVPPYSEEPGNDEEIGATQELPRSPEDIIIAWEETRQKAEKAPEEKKSQEAALQAMEAGLVEIENRMRIRNPRPAQVFHILLKENSRGREPSAALVEQMGYDKESARRRASEARKKAREIAPSVADHMNLERKMFLRYLDTRTYTQEARQTGR